MKQLTDQEQLALFEMRLQELSDYIKPLVEYFGELQPETVQRFADGTLTGSEMCTILINCYPAKTADLARLSTYLLEIAEIVIFKKVIEKDPQREPIIFN